MGFIKKIIPPKRVIVIDVGSYKIKLALCEYKNNEIKVINQTSVRQEESDIIAGEIANIFGIAENIEKGIKKLLNGYDYNPKSIIINILTLNTVSSSHQINYERIDKNNEINIQELDNIIGKVESSAFQKAKLDISKLTGYNDVDMKLITSSITSITVDGYRVSNPIGFTGKEISISTLNIFAPYSRYNLINKIIEHVGKEVISITPTEFCIPKLFEKSEYAYEDIMFVDIGNTKTTVIIQKNGSIIGFNNISIGINDLIKDIKQNHNKTKVDIVNSINEKDKYLKEKENFLGILEEGLIISIKEILKGGIMPSNFFISGGGNNDFVSKYITDIKFETHGINHIKKPSILELPNFNNIDFGESSEIKDKSNITLLSMIIATNDIINIKNNPIKKLLEEFLEKNEF